MSKTYYALRIKHTGLYLSAGGLWVGEDKAELVRLFNGTGPARLALKGIARFDNEEDHRTKHLRWYPERPFTADPSRYKDNYELVPVSTTILAGEAIPARKETK